MTTYFDVIPEDIINYILLNYIPQSDIINFVAILNEEFNRKILERSTRTYAYMKKFKPKNISWTQLLIIEFDLDYHIVKYESLTFTQLMENLSLLLENKSVLAMNDIRKKYPKELYELLFKSLTHMYSPLLASKINVVIHILGNNDPWYQLLRIAYTIDDYDKNLDIEIDEDQQEYSDDEREKMEKNAKLYEDRVDKYYRYVFDGKLMDMSIGQISLTRFPILLIYLNYLDQLNNLKKTGNPIVIDNIAKRLTKDLPIKLDTPKNNQHFIIHTLEHPEIMKRLIK